MNHRYKTINVNWGTTEKATVIWIRSYDETIQDDYFLTKIETNEEDIKPKLKRIVLKIIQLDNHLLKEINISGICVSLLKDKFLSITIDPTEPTLQKIFQLTDSSKRDAARVSKDLLQQIIDNLQDIKKKGRQQRDNHKASLSASQPKTQSPVKQSKIFYRIKKALYSLLDFICCGGPLADKIAQLLATTHPTRTTQTLSTYTKVTMRCAWATALVATVAALTSLYVLQLLPMPIWIGCAVITPLIMPAIASITLGLCASYLMTYCTNITDYKTINTSSGLQPTPSHSCTLQPAYQTISSYPQFQHIYSEPSEDTNSLSSKHTILSNKTTQPDEYPSSQP